MVFFMINFWFSFQTLKHFNFISFLNRKDETVIIFYLLSFFGWPAYVRIKEKYVTIFWLYYRECWPFVVTNLVKFLSLETISWPSINQVYFQRPW
jgi:hypothetical protein